RMTHEGNSKALEAEANSTLSSHESQALRHTLRDALSEANPEKSEVEVEELVEEYFPFAATKYSSYERARSDCEAAICRLKAILLKMEEHLQKAEETDSSSSRG
ncbi:Hypothetical protein FKW44_020484, partial [Caligus rogercresseyi]